MKQRGPRRKENRKVISNTEGTETTTIATTTKQCVIANKFRFLNSFFLTRRGLKLETFVKRELFMKMGRIITILRCQGQLMAVIHTRILKLLYSFARFMS